MNLRTILVIALTLAMFVGTTEGFTNHGFYWGIEIGDRFDYHMAIRYPNPGKNKNLDYYVIVDELPSIDENLTNTPRIRDSTANEENIFCSFYMMNDTRITSETVSEDHRRPLSWSAFPVGNWSLINDLYLMSTNGSLFETQTFDTATEWGYRLTSVVELFGRNETYSWIYSKVNGVLCFSELTSQNDVSFVSVQINIVGEAIPFIMVIGGISIGLFVAAFVVLKKKV